MSSQQEQLEAKVADIITKLYANAHGLPTKDLPDNVSIMTPSIEVAETISAITALIQEARVEERKLANSEVSMLLSNGKIRLENLEDKK